MADQAPKPDNPYDLGDTGYDPEVDFEMFAERSADGAASRAAASPSSPGSVPPTPGAPAQNHPPVLLQLAKDLDIPQEVIDRTPTEFLQQTVNYASRDRAQSTRTPAPIERPRDPRTGQFLPAGQPVQAEPAAGSQATQTPQPAADPFGLDNPELSDPNKYDQTVVGVLRKLAEHLTTTRQSVGHLAQFEVERQNTAREAKVKEIDQGFKKLGEKYGHIFGTQSAAQLRQDSPEWAARAKVFQAAANLDEPLDVALGKAADFYFGSQAKQATTNADTPYAVPAGPAVRELHPPAPVNGAHQGEARPIGPTSGAPGGAPAPAQGAALGARQAAWNAAAGARPTQVNGKGAKGDRAAELAAARWMRENQGPEDSSADELAGFLE